MIPRKFCSKTLILLCFALVASGCSRSSPPSLQWIGSDGVILAFGDSLTHGSGTTPDKAYPAVLAELINRQVELEATPGDKTGDGLGKLLPALQEHQPDLLILCLGGNDFLRKVELASTRRNLQQMIEMARAQGSQVMLIGVPQPALFGLDVHPLYRELAQQYQLPLEADIVAEVLSDRDTKSDAIHPNAAGYRQMAGAIAELLREAGAI